MSLLPIAEFCESVGADPARRRPYTLPLLLLLTTILVVVGCGGDADHSQEEETRDSIDASGAFDELEEMLPEGMEIITEVSDSLGTLRLDEPNPGATIGLGGFRISGIARLPDSTSRIHYRLVYDSTVSIARGSTPPVVVDSLSPTTFSADVIPVRFGGGGLLLEVFTFEPKSRREILKTRIPVILPDPEPSDSTTTTYAYFSHRRLGSYNDCRLVYPVAREVSTDIRSLARSAIYFLLKGPTPEEEEEGFFNRMPRNMMLDDISIDRGIARLDFSHHLTNRRRACQAQGIRAQIEQTMIQFDSVEAVVIQVNGRIWRGGER